MRTHTTFRRRLLSAVLAIVMTGSLLPAGVFTPFAHANNFGGPNALFIDQDGNWTVDFRGGSGTATSTWALAVVPNVKDGTTPAPSEHPNRLTAADIGKMTTFMTTVKAKDGYYSVDGDSDYTLSGGLFHDSGSLAKAIDDAMSTYATYTDADGNTKTAAADGIPFVAILYTNTDPPGVVMAEFTWKKMQDGTLSGGAINEVVWPATNSANTQMTCIDGDVTLLSYSLALTDGAGAYPSSGTATVTFRGPTATGTGVITPGGPNTDFLAGQNYTVTLSGPAPAMEPVTGNIIVTYKKASGAVATHTIPVQIGSVKAMAVSGGTFTIAQGAALSSGTWSPADRFEITSLADEFPVGADMGGGGKYGSYPGWFGGAASILDSNGYMELTLPSNSELTPNDGNTAPGGDKIELNSHPFTINATSSVPGLSVGTHTTSITYPYYYRSMDMDGIGDVWLTQYVSIPITIIVTEPAPAQDLTVSYVQPSGTAGTDYPSTSTSSIAGWPATATTVSGAGANFMLPTPSETNWVFNGWRLQNTSGTPVPGGTQTNIAALGGSSDITLEANWRKTKYTIKYNPGSYSGTAATGSDPADQTGDYNTSGVTAEAGLQNNTYTAPTGTRFVGWSTNPNAVLGGSDTLYQPGTTPTIGAGQNLVGTADAVGDYTVQLYAIWATPPKVDNAVANTAPAGGSYSPGDTISLNRVILTDSTVISSVSNGTNHARWSHVDVQNWALGGVSSPYVATTADSNNSFLIPGTAQAGEYVWVQVAGTGLTGDGGTTVTADDIDATAKWIRLVQLGAAEAELTAQVLYYDGSTYTTTAPSTLTGALPKINGQATYTANYDYDPNGGDTLTTTYTGDELTFLGWSTSDTSSNATNCSNPNPPAGMVHSPDSSHIHPIITAGQNAATVNFKMDIGRKGTSSSYGTENLAIPTKLYAVYQIKAKAALTVKFAVKGGTASSPTYSVWDGDADTTVSGIEAQKTVSPATASTTGMFGEATAQVTSSIDVTNYNYKFIGWMMGTNATTPNGTLITTDAQATAASAPLSNVSVATTGGMGAVTFKMATTPVATTLFAVYEPIPTQTLTVQKDAGISSVTVKRNRGGTITTLTLTGATTNSTTGITTYADLTVRTTDTITITSTAATNYTANGFDVTGDCTSSASDASITLVLDQGDDVIVLAKSKKGPPALTLTATDGAGVLSGTSLSNTTSPKVNAADANTSDAVIQTVTLGGPDASYFDLPTSGVGNASNETAANKPVISAGANADIILTPKASGVTWAVGTYNVTVTITYTNPNYTYSNGDPIVYSKTESVKYVVTESPNYTGTVTVKIDGVKAVTLNSGAVVTGSTTAKVKLSPSDGTNPAVDVDANGKRSVANLTAAQTVTVTYGGKTYTVPTQLSKTNPNITVELYTVTIDLADTAIETGALAVSNGHTPQLTLKITDGDISTNTQSRIQSVANGRSSAEIIVQGGRQVTIEANPGTTTATALNTTYSFDKWDDGTYDVDGAEATNSPVALLPISASPYTFTVQGTTVYTAYLKKENYKVLTYDDNETQAPGIVTNAGYAASNMPSSQVTTGADLTISTMVPILPGYQFVGWTTDITTITNETTWTAAYNADSNHTDGNGTAFKPGEKINMPLDKTLYAIWKDDVITLTVPTVTDGVYGDNYSLAISASAASSTASNITALNYSVTGAPKGLEMSGNVLTGRPATTGKDNGNAAAATYTHPAFTPDIVVTLATDYHGTGAITATLRVDGTSGTAANGVYHTAKKLTVEKAQPKVTGVSISGAAAGNALSGASYTVSVTGPRWEGDTAGWNFAYTEYITYALDGTPATFKRTSATPGSVNFTNVTASTTTPNNFEATGATTVRAAFAPEAEDATGKKSTDTGFTGKFDEYVGPISSGSNHYQNLQNNVWKSAYKDQSVTPGVSNGELKVKREDELEDATHDPYTVAKSWTYQTSGGSPLNARQEYQLLNPLGVNGAVIRNANGTDDVAGKQFVVKNTGSIPTGVLSYDFAGGNGSAFEIDGTPATTSLNAGDTRPIVVKVKTGKGPGTYTDILTVSGTAPGTSVSIFLTFTVDDPMTYDAYVTVLPQTIGGVAPTAAAALPSGAGLGLATTSGSGITVSQVPSTDADHPNEYKISGLKVGTTYQLKVTGTGGDSSASYTIPGVALSYPNDTAATVRLFQVGYKTHKAADDSSTDPATGSTNAWIPSSGHVSGAGWYVDGQYAKMTAHDSYTNTVTATSASTTYVFANSWKKSVTALNNATANTEGAEGGTIVATDKTFTAEITQPTTFYAHYKEQDANTFTLHYDDNLTAPDSAMVPADQTYDEAATATSHNFTVAGVPTRTGYVCVGWSTDNTKTAANWNSSSTDDFAPGDTITVSSTDLNQTKTLYAVWEVAEVWAPTGDDATDPWFVTLPDGMYGEAYAYQLPMPTTTDNAGVTLSVEWKRTTDSNWTNDLPGGLKLNTTTGLITGKPYLVDETGFQVRLTATHNYWDGSAGHTPAVVKKAVNKANGSESTAADLILTLKVMKHPVTLVNTSVTNVVTGANVSTGNYETTVAKLPLYGGKDGNGANANDIWNTLTVGPGGTANVSGNTVYAFTETVDLPDDDGTTNKGALSITAPVAPNDKFTAAGTSVTLQYTPSATEVDAHGNKHNEIYENGETTITASGNTATYNMKVQESRADWVNTNTPATNEGANITMWGPSITTTNPHTHQGGFKASVGYTVAAFSTATSTATTKNGSTASNQIKPQEFTLFNDGNQATGALTYTFATATDADRHVSKYFEVAFKDATNTNVTLELANGVATTDTSGKTFLVRPKVTNPALEPGTYTDTLVITNANGFSVSIALSLTVVKDDVPVKVYTYLWNKGDTVTPMYAANSVVEPKSSANNATELSAINAKKAQIPSSGSVKLVDVSDPTNTSKTKTATWTTVSSPAADSYYAADIDYDTTYYVVINGYTLPGVTISRSSTTSHVYLYQVTTAFYPNDATNSNVAATAAPTAGNSATAANGGVTPASSIYVVKDEAATVTVAADADVANSGYSYKELQDTTAATAPSGTVKSTAHTYTTMVTAPVEFTAVYSKGFTLTYKPNGSGVVLTASDAATTAATDVAESVTSGSTVTVKAPAVFTKTVSSKTYTGWTQPNYTFVGWSTSASTTPAGWATLYAAPGHTDSTDTAYAPGDTITISASEELFAIWTPEVNPGLSFPDKTIEVVHYDKLNDGTNHTVDGRFSVSGTPLGTVSYTRDTTTLPGGQTGGTDNITFDATNHKFTSGSNAVKYDAANTANNTATTVVTATDGGTGGNGSTLDANITIKVVPADTEITKVWDGADAAVKAGDSFDFNKLTISNGPVTVVAKRTDGSVNNAVDFGEQPATGDTDNVNVTGNGDLDGTWTVTEEDGTTPITTFLPGKNKYVVTFTPKDEGFKPSSKTIELTFEKLIEEVTVSLHFPVGDDQPNTAAQIENPLTSGNVPVVNTTASPTAAYTDVSVVGNVIWAGTFKADGSFDDRDPITATVTIKPNGDWKFLTDTTTTDGVTTYDFVGNFSNLDNSPANPAAKDQPSVKVVAMDPDGKSATLQWTWDGEDRPSSQIVITVTAPTDGATPDLSPVPVGYPFGSFTNSAPKWIEMGIDTNGDSTPDINGLADVTASNYATLSNPPSGTGGSFVAGKKYVFIVTATVTDGYYFEGVGSSETSHLAAPTDATPSSDYATINNMNAKVLSVTPATGAQATTAVLAVEFTASANTVVGLAASEAKLDYYVATATGATTSMTAPFSGADKHFSTGATGHNTDYGFTLKANGTAGDTITIYTIDGSGAMAQTQNFVLFVDGTSGTPGKYDSTDILLSAATTSGSPATTTYSTPGYTFIPAPAGGLTSALDGKTLYAAYVDGNGTASAAIDSGTAGNNTTSRVIAVGTLHVKPLEAKSIAAGNSGWHIANGANASQKLFWLNDTDTTTAGTQAGTATVEFNTGDAMAKTVTTVSYAVRGTAYGVKDSAAATETTTTTKLRPSYYYMLDVNDNFNPAAPDFDANDVELTDGYDVSAYGGKSVYICYTDVNGHLVATKTGVIGANFTVDIDDENGQDPEYGDKLTGEPKKPDGMPDDPTKYTYQWEKLDPDTGDWHPIPGATSPEYVPGKPDVGGTIRVVVTDPGTGTTVPSTERKIQKRSINFDVAVVDKLYDGDYYNDDHAYTTGDFTVTRVDKVWDNVNKVFVDAKKNTTVMPFGGLLLGDEITISPYNAANASVVNEWNELVSSNHHTGRPTYKKWNTTNSQYENNETVGSEIRWPQVLEVGTTIGTDTIVTHAVNATDGYDPGGADKDYYRLVPQPEKAPRGEITDGTVTHVDVSFQEWPTYGHEIPGEPMGVTDERETMAGEKAHTDSVNDRQDYVAKWYTVADGKTFDPNDASTCTAITIGSTPPKFTSGVRYAVAVTVKPQTGYNYELDEAENPYTRFYFHFGEFANAVKVEVTDNQHNTTPKPGQGVWQHTVSGEDVYTMYYTLGEVAKPKIAYVNVSIPQPVAEVAPATSVNVIQLIGTDNKVIDNTGDSVVSGGTPTWEYKNTSGSWVAATTGTGLSATGEFQADTEYRVTFTLTASNYEYLYTDDTTPVGVRFVASGEGELLNANIDGDHTLATIVNDEIIASVVTADADTSVAESGKTKYKVTITYKPVKSGKADLIDVVVDASAATQAGVTKTGPEVSADKQPTYNLDSTATTSNKWFYWDTTLSTPAWAAVVVDGTTPANNKGVDADGKFLAGYDYRVEGTVKLVDSAHYTITNKTKFYIAGYEVKTDDNVELHNPSNSEKALTPSANATNGAYAAATTFKLVKTFSIPAEEIPAISVTHNLPLTSGTTVPQNPNDWSDSKVANKAADSDVWVSLGTTDTYKNDFATAGTGVTEGTDTFVEDTYYRVTTTISPEGGYVFKTGSTESDKAGNTVVVINGVAVNLDDPTAKEVKNSKNEVVAYVMAKSATESGKTVIKAMLVAKVESSAINPIELRHNTIVPATGAPIPTAPFLLLNSSETRYEVDTTTVGGDTVQKVKWQFQDKDNGNAWTDVVVDDTNSANNVGVDEDDNFLGNTVYRVTVGVKAKDNNVFAANDVIKGTVTVNSLVYSADVAVTEDTTNTPPDPDVHRKTADVTITFNPTADGIKGATLVTAYFKYKPVEGKVPDTETYETGKYSYKFPMNVENHPTETIGTLTVADGVDSMQTFDVTWYDTTDITGDFHPSTNHGTALTGTGDPFAVDKKYTVAVKVKPAPGWKYILNATEDPDNPNTKFKIYAGDEGFDANVWQDEDNDCYIMWYTFSTLNKPKIAYVNVSIPQPVAEVAPATSVNVIQLIGTDNKVIDNTGDSVVNGGTPTWEYKNTSGSWVDATTGTGLSATGEFQADTEYRVTFTLTASNYEYLYTDDTTPVGVRFVASGEGELLNANIDGNHTLDSTTTPAIINDEIIASVVTADADTSVAESGKTKYKVTITYKPVKSGKADLIDVVVDASAATQAGVTKTGPEVSADKQPTYNLDSTATTSNKWFYWDATLNSNAGGWAAVVVDGTTPANNKGVDADGKFLAGYDYRVEGTVKLVDSAHYTITNKTKFYIAGYEVKTDDNVELHNPSNSEKALTPSANATNGAYAAATTFKLVKTFHIPTPDDVDVGSVAINYVLPADQGTVVEYVNYVDDDVVTIPTYAADNTNGTKWYPVASATDFANSGSGAMMTIGTSKYSSTSADAFYMVVNVIEPNGGYALGKSTSVYVDGFEVTLDSADATSAVDYTATGRTSGLMGVRKTYDSTSGNITLQSIYKVPKPVTGVTINNVTITYPEPVANEDPSPTRDGSKWTYEYLGDATKVKVDEDLDTTSTAIAKDTVGTTWYTTPLTSAPTQVSDFNPGGTGVVELSANFLYDKYYMVEGTIEPLGENSFDTENDVYVTINGILVKVGDNAVKAKYDAEGNAIGWAIAVADGDNIKARYIAKSNSDTLVEQVAINYTTPLVPNKAAEYVNYLDRNMVTVYHYGATANHDPDNGAVVDPDGTRWYPVKNATDFANVDGNAMMTIGTTPYDDGGFYMVENVIRPNTGYRLSTGTIVYVDGFEVEDDSTVATDGYVSTGNTTGLLNVKKTYNSATGFITVQSIYKVPDKEPGVVSSISITYPEPVANEEPLPKRDNTKWTYEYLGDDTKVEVNEDLDTASTTIAKDTVGSTWYTTPLTSAPTQVSNFDPSGTGVTELTDAGFDFGKYYMVEGTITPKTGNVLDDTVYVTINGILVKVGDTNVKAKYDAEGNAIGWAIAQFVVDDNGTAGDDTDDVVTGIKARYIAKTVDPDTKVIDRVEAEVAVPAVDANISDAVTLIQALFENNKDATNRVTIGNHATCTWTESDSFGTGYGPTNADGKFHAGKYYQAVFTVTTNTVADGYTFQSKDANNDGTDDDFVAFRVNGVTKTDNTWVNDKRNPAGRTDDATRNGIKVITEQADGDSNVYTITVQFPLTGDKKEPVVIGRADVPSAKKPDGSDYKVGEANIWVDADKPYEIKNAADAYWQHWNGTDWVTVTNANEPFKAGDFYRAVMTVEMKDAQKNLFEFTTSTEGRVNSSDAVAGSLPTTAPVNTALKTTIVHNVVDGEVPTITLAKEFLVAKEKTVVHVVSRVPEAGVYAYAVDADVAIYNVDHDSDRYELVKDDGVHQGRWYVQKNGAFVLVDQDAFIAGEDYYLIITADMKDNAPYAFYDTAEGYEWLDHYTHTLVDNAKLLFTNDPKWVKDSNGDTVVSYVAFKYTIPAPEAKVIPGFANQPIKGQPLGDIWTNENDFTEINSFWSTDEDGADIVADSTAAAASTVYYATIDVIAEDGVVVTPEYSFNGIAPGGDFVKADINGTDANGKTIYRLTYRFKPTSDDTPSSGGGGGGTTTVESPVVYYHLKDQGVTDDPTAEKVRRNSKPTKVPKVKAMTGLKFLGWSEVDPSTLPAGKLPTLVDPTTFKITADKWFYAVYEQGPEVDHLHYVIGFPNGTFAPDAKITRAEVATIIARSCLEGFVEGANYGNPGNYNDVTTHWAFSAIAFCAREGVFNGYEDGTFRPDRYITRQELATAVARLAGIQTSQGVPFNDRNQIASWAMNGVYTAYANGWIKGYEDGTFQPERDISRAETVKIFNGYLKRGVDAKGLEGLKEYIHTGVASNNTQDNHDEYMTWPDVPKTHWAYHEIIEAANDHNYHWQDAEKKIPPEDWDEVYIDKKWRYNDNENDGAEQRDENMTLQKTFTVTYLVSSNGVTYDAITETVERFASPKPENMPIAVPNEGYRFAGWSSTDPSTGEITLVDPTASSVTADKWYYAVFEEDKPYQLPIYTVTYVIGALGSYDGVTVEQVEMYQAPSVSGLPQPTAVGEGYRFIGWSETDPTTGSYTIVDPTANYVTGDKTFYAVFEEDKPYQLPVYTVTYVIGESGSYGGATVEQVEMFQAPSVSGLPQPVANEGYRFVGWSETDPATGSYSIMDPTANYVTSDKTFYAVYEAV